MSTAFFYIILCVVCYVLCSQSEKTGNKKFVVWAYVLIAFFSAIRYDTGNDYANYFREIENLSVVLSRVSSFRISDYFDVYSYYCDNEIAFFVFNLIFSHFSFAPILVIGVYGCLAVLFLYKTLEYFKCHKYGLLLFFIMEILFCYWDWVRQSVAISLCLYSLTYVEKGDWKRYLATVCAGICFHLSAVFFLPVYFLQKLHINRWLSVAIIVAALMLVYTNVIYSFSQMLYYLPFYNEYSTDVRVDSFIMTNSYKIRLTIYAIVSIIAILKLPKERATISNVLLFGIVLLILSQGGLIIMRAAELYFGAITFALPLAIKQPFNQVYKIVISLALLMCSVIMINDVIKGQDRGCSPYTTVFSSEYRNHTFKLKNY